MNFASSRSTTGFNDEGTSFFSGVSIASGEFPSPSSSMSKLNLNILRSFNWKGEKRVCKDYVTDPKYSVKAVLLLDLYASRT